MSGQDNYNDRPSSEQLTDLSVYVVPPELWKERLHSAISDVISETVCAGFIRVHPETPVSLLRSEIESQLEDDVYIPQEYVFVKNLGRRLAKVGRKQEMQLKVKNFLDSKSNDHEIFLLEGGSDTQSIHPSSVSSSYRGENSQTDDPYHLDNYRSKGTFASQQKPVPPIKTGEATSTNTSHAYPAQGAAYPASSSTSRHVLTNSNSSFNSVQSQTDSSQISAYSSRTVHSNISTGATRPLVPPPIESNPSSKAVTFDHPQELHTNSTNHYHHRPPTPGPPLVQELSGSNSNNSGATTNNHQATQWSRQNSRAQLSSPTIASSNQNHPYNNRVSHPATRSGQNGHDEQTPPPLSATPTQGMSPYPQAPLGGGGDEDRGGQEEEYLPPLSCTPPPTSPGSLIRPKMVATSSSQRETSRTQHDDSGNSDRMGNQHHNNERWEDRNGHLNRSSSSLKREDLARQKQEEESRRRKQEEEARRRKQEEEAGRRKQEEEARRRKQEEEDQHSRDEANRRRQRELSDRERQRKEDEERRRREEEEESRRRRQQELEEEEEERRRREEADRNNVQLTIEGKNNNQSDHENQKQTLLEELAKLKQERQSTEKEREELVRKAKQLQSKTQNRRNQARDVWKKKYFEEKKKSPPLEEQCTKLRQELDAIHRRIVNSLEGAKDKDNRRGVPLEKPSPESNVKIQATRLQHDIEDLQRRVETVKMKLTAEMKLRNQAETELRALRAELTQKKINVTLSRRGPREDNPELYTPRNQPPLTNRT